MGYYGVSAAPFGESGKLTGFWTTRPEAIKDMIAALEAECRMMCGGGSFGSNELLVSSTPIQNVETLEDFAYLKDANIPVYDDGEVFVSKIQDLAKVKTVWYDKFLTFSTT